MDCDSLSMLPYVRHAGLCKVGILKLGPDITIHLDSLLSGHVALDQALNEEIAFEV